jgi:hypothetical protein
MRPRLQSSKVFVELRLLAVGLSQNVPAANLSPNAIVTTVPLPPVQVRVGLNLPPVRPRTRSRPTDLPRFRPVRPRPIPTKSLNMRIRVTIKVNTMQSRRDANIRQANKGLSLMNKDSTR